MISLFGFNLIFLTGIITGLLFIFCFLTCCTTKFCRFKGVGTKRFHKIIMYSTFISFLIHAALAVLLKLGVWI